MNTDASPKKSKILIYKDIFEKIVWLSAFCQKHNVEAIAFETPSACVDLVFEQKPTWVILSMQMPGQTGLETISSIRSIDDKVAIVLSCEFESHSIQKQALARGANYFRVFSEVPVLVKSIIESKGGLLEQAQKEKVVFDDSSERMKDRYPVSGPIVVTHQQTEFKGVFENISMEGAKIRIAQIPPLGSAIHIQWSLQKGRIFDLQGVTIRQSMVLEPKDEWVWVVGIKFTHLNNTQIKDLSELIAQIAKFYEKKFEFVDFEQIRKILLRKEQYLSPILQGQKAPSLIERSMKKVKDYERKAFGFQSKEDLCIARMFTYRVLCHVISRSLDWVQIHPEEGLKQCVPLIVQLLELIEKEETEIEVLIRQAVETDQVEIKRQLVESSNLIAQEKEKLIQVFHDRCKFFSPDKQVQEGFDAIMARFEDLQSYQRFVEKDIAKEQRQIKKSLEAPIYKTSKSLQFEKQKFEKSKVRKMETAQLRKNILPLVCAGIIISTLMYFGMSFYRSFINPMDLKLTLSVEKARLIQKKHVEITASIQAWQSLDEARKLKVMDELEVYLTRYQYFQAKIKDKEGKVLAAILSTHDAKKIRYLHEIVMP